MKKQLLLLVMMLMPLLTKAYDAYIGGIYYNFNNEAKTATVTCRSFSSQNNAYFGVVEIPSSVVYNGNTYIVTEIGGFAFGYCENVTSVSIPNTVTTIGSYAFSVCTSLNSITIPNSVTSIGEFAFNFTGWLNNQPDGILYLDNWLIGYKGEKPIGELTIADGTRGIAYYALDGCGELVSVKIPNSVTSIGQFAFKNCCGLSFITLPSNIKSIETGAFKGCYGLTYLTIPDGVTSIESIAFSGCSGLTSITIPNSITSIKEAAFENCSGLTTINIPNSVTVIGAHAFDGCSSLISATISSSVTSIEAGTFANCRNLTTIIIPDNVTSISRDTGSSNWGAFQNCTNLTSVTIGNNVTIIGEHTFCGCSNLKDISIPESVTKIGGDAFNGCSSLTSIILPNNIASIGSGAFAWCSGLTSVIIPNGLTNIDGRTFWGCSGLTSVTIPNSVTSIGELAFSGCSLLESLNLPEDLKIIRNSAFKECNALKTIIIPSSVEFIYQEAFANCNALESVKAKPGTPPFLYDNSFSNFSVPLEVPKGCKEEYQAAQGWKNFTNISESDKGYYKLIFIVDNVEYKSYKIEEGSSITPEPEPTKEGYTFSGWSEIPETMPAHNVTVTGTFSINKYKLTYTVDGEEYKTCEVEYGATITVEAAPTKEGYTFSGWSEIPETMPAHDVTVTGSFTINSYKLTYMIDDKVYKETMYEYGAIITPEPQPEGDYATFEWTDLPQTMPAHDVVVYANYTSGIIEVLMTRQGNIRIYSPNGKKLDKLQKGLNIVVLDDGTVKKAVVK